MFQLRLISIFASCCTILLIVGSRNVNGVVSSLNHVANDNDGEWKQQQQQQQQQQRGRVLITTNEVSYISLMGLVALNLC